MKGPLIPGASRLGGLRSRVRRALNPRYAGLPADFFEQPVRILDAGCGPKDGIIARDIFRRGCWYEGISLWQPDPENSETRAFDRYHQQDLDKTNLDFLEDSSFDYVVCSHTLEHLDDGIAVLRRLCKKVRPDGYLYLEWPSLESLDFPIRGQGLNFYDDPTHKSTYGLDRIVSIVTEAGLDVAYAGQRRNWVRLILSPLLAIYHSLKARRLRLYDLWDLTGFAYVVTAQRPPDGHSR